MSYVRIIFIIFLIIGLLIILFNSLIGLRSGIRPAKKDTSHNFCILIPARYESNVIEDLLISIKKQTHKVAMTDVYVIVESKEDETVNICSRYNVNVVYRKDLTKKRKGYALNDAISDILKDKKKYDAYFIFDADNILDKYFIKNMIPIYDKGYDLACGYRNCKNGNDSVVAAASSLTFSLINTLFNDSKNKKGKNITFSGTGFYIRGDIIEKLGGYPFHSLTEDYEISMYAVINNLTTYYNKKSVFYDEQPVKYKDTINQRQRWIRGFFDVRKMYINDLRKSFSFKNSNYASKFDMLIGVIPYIFIIIGSFIYLFGLLFNMIINGNKLLFIELFIFLLLVYIVLLIFTFIILMLESNKLDLSLKMKVKVLFYNPIFIISYIKCAIPALLKKNIEWKKQEHGKRS